MFISITNLASCMVRVHIGMNNQRGLGVRVYGFNVKGS